MMNTTLSGCSLCSIELPRHPIIEGDNAFCCSGCHSVFSILSTKNELDNFQQHPLFKQAIHAGLISNPALLDSIRRNRVEVTDAEKERIHLEIGEMWCPACAEIIRLLLLQQKGVLNCVVDYSTDLAAVEFSPRHIGRKQIESLIQSFGYQTHGLQDPIKKAVSFDLYLRFIIAAFFSLNIMMLSYPLYATYFDFEDQGFGKLFAWISFAASLPVIGYSGWPIFRRFFFSLQAGLFGMETLVVIGVSSAFLLSLYELLNGRTTVYFDSMSVIIVFVLLGKIVEARAKFSAKDSILRLTKSMPRRGRKRFSDGSLSFILAKEICLGDLIVVFAGEKIVLDGVVIEGEGGCDESIMTGEVFPVTKEKGSKVIAGTILQQGSITFAVNALMEDSTLQKIINTVQCDIGNKSKYIRAADQVVHWFVPIVIIIAFGAALWSWWFGIADAEKTIATTAIIRAISVLLISCPCAIGIAAPLAEAYLMNRLANLGVIVRNRGVLSLIGKETVFVFDKTGTVTEGRFTVLEGLEVLSDYQCSILKGLATHSNHLVSCAISRALNCSEINLDSTKESPGFGIQGSLNGKNFLLGSAIFLKQHGIDVKPFSQSQSHDSIVSFVFFAEEDRCLTRLVLGDRIRPEIKMLIQNLAPTQTILLSGDSFNTVEAVAKACGFDKFQSETSPLKKRDYIESLRQQGNIVCMLGDGINDAPALTGAHIGISVISAADISIQVSDLLLTTEQLLVIPKIRLLAQKGQRIIKQNIFWAFFYNILGLGLAACGILSPIFAAFAMVSSSLMVLFNAKRI